MRSLDLQTILSVLLLGQSAVVGSARAEENRYPAIQLSADGGVDGSANPAASDADRDQLTALTLERSNGATVDAGLADAWNATPLLDAGSDVEPAPIPKLHPSDDGDEMGKSALPEHATYPSFGRTPTEDGVSPPVLAVRGAPTPTGRLPMLGLMVDIGVPDGLIGSLSIRPWSWVRFSGGGGSNSISHGWRAGIALLPFGVGPAVSLEYGRYQDGDANALAKKFMGSGFDGSPVLNRVGYEYVNAHLGLDFGSRNFVFFLHGGLTILAGQIHNLNASTSGAGATGTTEVVVRQDPKFKVWGPSLKLGLLVYIW